MGKLFEMIRKVYFPFDFTSVLDLSDDFIIFLYIAAISAIFVWSVYCLSLKVRHLKAAVDEIADENISDQNPLAKLWKLYRMSFFDTEGARKTKHDAENFLGYSMVVSESMSRRTWTMIPGLFVGMGVLGTFWGLTYGVGSFDAQNTEIIQQSISQLLSGMNTAFCTSVWGMSLSIIFGFYEKRAFRGLRERVNHLVERLNEKYLYYEDYALDDHLAIRSIRDSLVAKDEDRELKTVVLLHRLLEQSEQQSKTLSNFSSSLAEALGDVLDRRFSSSQDTLAVIKDALDGHSAVLHKIYGTLAASGENQDYKTVTLLHRLLEQSEGQSRSLSNFSTDLAEAIGDVLEKTFTASFGRLDGAIQSLVTERGEGTQEVLKDIQGALSGVLDDFKGSVGSVNTSTRELLENALEDVERAVGGALDDFKDSVSAVNTSTKELLENTLGEVGRMVNGALGSFKSSVEAINTSAQELLERVVTVSERQDKLVDLVARFETLTKTAADLQGRYNEAADTMADALPDINELAQRAQSSLEAIQTSQESLLEMSKKVREENEAMLAERRRLSEETSIRLDTLLSTHETYVSDFGTIEDALSGIFKELETGLQQYQTGVNRQLDESVKEFSSHFKTSSEILGSAVSEIGEYVEDLGESVEALIKNVKRPSSDGAGGRL